jgi:hypothetical protein
VLEWRQRRLGLRTSSGPARARVRDRNREEAGTTPASAGRAPTRSAMPPGRPGGRDTTPPEATESAFLGSSTMSAAGQRERCVNARRAPASASQRSPALDPSETGTRNAHRIELER